MNAQTQLRGNNQLLTPLPLRFIADDKEVIDNKFKVVNHDKEVMITLDDEEATYYV